MKPKVIIITNSIWYTVNFRLNLAKKLKENGFDIIAAAPSGTGNESLLKELGVQFVHLPVDGKGANPLFDLIYFLRLLKVLYTHRPSICLSFTIKPNIYGGLACKILGVRSVHNISGLGTTFIKTNWITGIVKGLYKISLKFSTKVFFQNVEDLELFVNTGLVEKNITELLPGSGVDTEWFAPIDTKYSKNVPFRFLLSARLLWDKGVGEYVEAARLLHSESRSCEFQLLGFTDFANRTAISKKDIQQWEQEGVIKFLGSADDVRPFIANADCIVLPSYREGTPRALLEAASMCKPIITTNSIGCYNTIEDGVTGLLCNARDHFELAEKMRQMCSLSRSMRIRMGRKGREKMIKEYSEAFVLNKYIAHVKYLSQVV